jgi:hypothetical protein
VRRAALTRGTDLVDNSAVLTFKGNVSGPPRTRSDFTYKISPTVISIGDTSLGKCAVSEDIEAVLRKIEYWHQGSPISLPAKTFRTCAE